jgi:pimeloyl-ACP methyl ester carboxylesterase
MESIDQFLASGGSQIRFRDEGKGVPVVFLHGWTLDLDMWQPQANALGHQFRIVRFDRRGFGLSSGTPDLAQDVEDFRSLLDHLELAQVAIIGMSQGARLAIRVALDMPQRVSALVLDGPPNLTSDDGAGADEDLPMDEFRKLVRTRGVQAFRQAWRAHPFTELQSTDARARELLSQMIARYPGEDLSARAPAASHAIGAPALSQLRKPVLVINGAKDSDGRRRTGEELRATLPNALRALIPNAGHLANLDNPEFYNDVLSGFLLRQARIAA